MAIRIKASERLRATSGTQEPYALPKPDYPKSLDALASKSKSKSFKGFKLIALETEDMPFYKAVDLAESELGKYKNFDSEFEQIQKFTFPDGSFILPLTADGSKYLLARKE